MDAKGEAEVEEAEALEFYACPVLLKLLPLSSPGYYSTAGDAQSGNGGSAGGSYYDSHKAPGMLGSQDACEGTVAATNLLFRIMTPERLAEHMHIYIYMYVNI